MSLYNQLFKENKDADVLLGVLGINKAIFIRYRDIYLNKEGDKITVYTRCGGGNRETCSDMYSRIRNHPNYIRDYDDSFDNTYAYVEFSVPERYRDMCKHIAPKEDPLTVSQKFDQAVENMKKDPHGPEMKQAMDIFGPIFKEIEKDINKDKNNGGIKFLGI